MTGFTLLRKAIIQLTLIFDWCPIIARNHWHASGIWLHLYIYSINLIYSYFKDIFVILQLLDWITILFDLFWSIILLLFYLQWLYFYWLRFDCNYELWPNQWTNDEKPTDDIGRNRLLIEQHSEWLKSLQIANVSVANGSMSRRLNRSTNNRSESHPWPSNQHHHHHHRNVSRAKDSWLFHG